MRSLCPAGENAGLWDDAGRDSCRNLDESDERLEIEGWRHPERRHLSAGANDPPLIRVMGHEIPRLAGENAGPTAGAQNPGCAKGFGNESLRPAQDGRDGASGTIYLKALTAAASSSFTSKTV